MNIFNLFLFGLLVTTCQEQPLKTVCNLPSNIKESSGLAYDANTKLFWTIEDANNKSKLYGFDEKGVLQKEIKIENAKNHDWEDILIDDSGNLYIGDFGNNGKKREKYAIYKVSASDLNKKKIDVQEIEFKLEGKKEKDFEAFILQDGMFYLFSKEKDETTLYSLPNKIGRHKAEKQGSYEFKGKGNHKITAAAISSDGTKIFLLNAKKIWVFSNYEDNQFFKGDVSKIEFHHDSQKEGMCLKSANEIYITDESNSGDGNLYMFKFND